MGLLSLVGNFKHIREGFRRDGDHTFNAELAEEIASTLKAVSKGRKFVTEHKNEFSEILEEDESNAVQENEFTVLLKKNHSPLICVGGHNARRPHIRNQYFDTTQVSCEHNYEHGDVSLELNYSSSLLLPIQDLSYIFQSAGLDITRHNFDDTIDYLEKKWPETGKNHFFTNENIRKGAAEVWPGMEVETWGVNPDPALPKSALELGVDVVVTKDADGNIIVPDHALSNLKRAPRELQTIDFHAEDINRVIAAFERYAKEERQKATARTR